MAATSSSVERAVGSSGFADACEEAEGVAKLPMEMLLKVFGYLPQRDLDNSWKVCRSWRSVSCDESLAPLSIYLKVHHKDLPVSVIDEYSWKKHVNLEEFGLSVDDAPILDRKATVENLKELYSKMTVEWDAGGTLILMPRALTLKKIIDIGKAPKSGPKFKLSYIWENITEQFGDVVVRESYWVWMANGLINETRDKTPIEQNQIMAGIGCEMPGVLEATTNVVLTYMISLGRERLFDWDGKTYYDTRGPDPRALTDTRCRETVNGWHIVVGGQSPHGLRIIRNHYRLAGLGVSPARKF